MNWSAFFIIIGMIGVLVGLFSLLFTAIEGEDVRWPAAILIVCTLCLAAGIGLA